MKTQIELAREGVTTSQMEQVAKEENIAAEVIRKGVAAGHIVIPCNPNRPDQKICGIGKGLRPKSMPPSVHLRISLMLALELRKAKIAEQEHADTLMELSTGGDLDAIRRAVLDGCSLPVGNVPALSGFCRGEQKIS